MMDSTRRDAAVNGLTLIGACVLFALSPFVTFVFLISMVILSGLLPGFPKAVPSIFWLRKGLLITALISVLWYQKAQAITGLCDNAFFKLSFLTGPVPSELWISLFFAVIAGFQAAVTLCALNYALPIKPRKKETHPDV
jgi:hypothetical protein